MKSKQLQQTETSERLSLKQLNGLNPEQKLEPDSETDGPPWNLETLFLG